MISCQIGDLMIQIVPASQNNIFFGSGIAELRLSKPNEASISVMLNAHTESILVTNIIKKQISQVLLNIEHNERLFPENVQSWIRAAREVITQQAIEQVIPQI